MKVSSLFRRAALAVLTCGVIAMAPLGAVQPPAVTATVVELTGTTNEGVMNAEFKVAVSNDAPSDITAFFVIFDDEASVLVGDIAAGKSQVSGTIARSIDTTGMASHNSPIKVRLKFTYEGGTVEMPYNLPFPRR